MTDAPLPASSEGPVSGGGAHPGSAPAEDDRAWPAMAPPLSSGGEPRGPGGPPASDEGGPGGSAGAAPGSAGGGGSRRGAAARSTSPPAIHLAPSPETIVPGALVTIAVRIDGARGVRSVPFHLVYPADLLEYAGGEAGSFLTGTTGRLIFMADGPPGRLFVALSRLGGATGGSSGSGTLCTLRFRARAPGAAGFSFEDAHVFLGDRSEAEATFEAAALEIR